jgi:spore germination protein YaaH
MPRLGRRPSRRAARGWLAAVVAVAAVAPWQHDAGAATPARFVTGWIPNWSSSVVADGTRAINSGVDDVFAEVSPFGFTATGVTTIAVAGTEANLTTAVNAVRSKRLPVMPSITDGTGKSVMAGILADPTTRAQHVQTIVNLVVGRNYDGIDLDYEGFAFTDGRATWPTTRPNWAAFIAELGPALHAQGKLLAVTVPPIWDNGASGYTVYAWPEMLPHIDRLRLMVYDWSVGSAGPVAPMSWLNSVLAYVQSVVPTNQRSKVQIGVPAYGRSWARITSGICPDNAELSTVALQMENANNVAAANGAVPTRDPSGELRFTYDRTFTGIRGAPPAPPAPPTPGPPTIDNVAAADSGTLQPADRLTSGQNVTCTIRRTVYFPDEFSVVQRANAALAAGMSGIAIWALGYETPNLWGPLMGIDVPRGPGGPGPVGSLDTAVVNGGIVSVSGWAVDPEFDLPVAVTVSVTNPGQALQMSGPIIAREIRGEAGWGYPSRTHGFVAGVSIAAAPGANVCVHAQGFGDASDQSVVLSCRTV